MKTFTISMDGFEIDAETATEAAGIFKAWIKDGLLENPVIEVTESLYEGDGEPETFDLNLVDEVR